MIIEANMFTSMIKFLQPTVIRRGSNEKYTQYSDKTPDKALESNLLKFQPTVHRESKFVIIQTGNAWARAVVRAVSTLRTR